jgi:hypothetical protein
MADSHTPGPLSLLNLATPNLGTQFEQPGKAVRKLAKECTYSSLRDNLRENMVRNVHKK